MREAAGGVTVCVHVCVSGLAPRHLCTCTPRSVYVIWELTVVSHNLLSVLISDLTEAVNQQLLHRDSLLETHCGMALGFLLFVICN